MRTSLKTKEVASLRGHAKGRTRKARRNNRSNLFFEQKVELLRFARNVTTGFLELPMKPFSDEGATISSGKLIINQFKTKLMKKSTSLLKFYCAGILISWVCFETKAQCKSNFTYQVSGCIVKFNNISTYLSSGTSAPQYAWTFGDGATSTVQSPSHTYPSTSSYTVCLAMYLSNPACADSICKIITVSCPTGIEEFQPFNSLSVLSNPVRSATLIHYNLMNATQVQITLFDLLGNVISVLENVYQNPGDHYLNLNAGTLESRIYFLQLNADGNLISQKVVVAQQ